jgi:hypothetical protein
MAVEKTIEIKVDEKQAVQSINNLNKEISKTEKEVTNSKEGLKDFTNVADGLTGGMIGKFSSLTGTLSKVAGGFKGIGAAIAASGIGLLVIAISSVAAAFNASEEGQNKFAKLMGVIGSVVGNVMDVISDLGEIIIGVLSGDSEAIKSATAFGKKIFDVVGLPIKNIISVVQTAANVIKGLWNDGIDGALTALENGVDDVKGNFKDAANAINDGATALKNFGEEALKEAKIAQQIADQRAKADKLERGLIVEKAEAERKRADLLEKAQQRDKFNQAQRIAFLREAGKLDEEITAKEIASAKLRRDAIIEENKLSKSNKEALKAEEEAKAQVIILEANRLKRQKEVTSQIQGLVEQENAIRKAALDERKKQIEEEQKKKEDAINKEIEDEKKRQEAIENLRKSYRQRLEDLDDVTEVQKVDRQQQRALAELESLNATEEQKAELLKYYSEIRETAQKNDTQKAIDEAKKKADEEIAIEKSVAEAKKSIQDQTFAVAESGIGLLKSLFEKNKGLQKAALIAESAIGISKIIINTQAANAAARLKYALLPGGAALAAAEITLNKIGAGIGIVANVASTAKALSALGGGGGAGGGTSVNGDSGAGAPTTAPQFNVVGNAGVNQIANTINGQQPIQAYVVANNVTTAQSLDRNIVNNASLG